MVNRLEGWGYWMVHGCAEFQTIGESGNSGIGSITDLPMVRGEEGARGGPDREVGRKKSPGGEGILSGRRECEAGFNPHPLTTADVEGLADEGYIFVFTSHHPEHALAIADRVVMMQRGAIIRDGAPPTLMPVRSRRMDNLGSPQGCRKEHRRIEVPSGLPR
jgi:hypothetical protein